MNQIVTLLNVILQTEAHHNNKNVLRVNTRSRLSPHAPEISLEKHILKSNRMDRLRRFQNILDYQEKK